MADEQLEGGFALFGEVKSDVFHALDTRYRRLSRWNFHPLAVCTVGARWEVRAGPFPPLCLASTLMGGGRNQTGVFVRFF